MQQPCHAGFALHVFADRLEGSHLRTGRGEGGCLQQGIHLATIARKRSPGLRLAARTHQLQGQLPGEHFVKGEARTRRGVRIQIGGAFRRVQGADRGAEIRPDPAFLDRVIQPVRHRRAQRHGTLDGLAHRLGDNSCRQWINRFQQRQAFRFFLGRHQIGMHDLDFRTVALALARHDPRFANWQQSLQIIRPGMEKDEVQKSGLVEQAHLVGLTLAAAGNVFFHLCGQGDDLTVRRLNHRRALGPVDQPGRLVKQDIFHPGAGQLCQQGRQPRPDTGQGDHILE